MTDKDGKTISVTKEFIEEYGVDTGVCECGDPVLKYAVIYDDTPPPKWWRHPIQRWKWKKKRLIAYYDFEEEITDEGLTITFHEPIEVES